MNACLYGLNNNQLAVAMHAAWKIEQHALRLIYTIPAGQGKSRVMIGVVTALCQNLKRKPSQKYNFQMVYNHEQQM